MPKYFIHFRMGDRIVETLNGIELPNLNAAKAEAISSARQVLKNALRSGEEPPDTVVIEDDKGADPAETVDRLLATLDREDLVHALNRMNRRRVMRLVE